MNDIVIRSDVTALLIIDMQNGFCHEKGTLAQDGANIADMRAVIPNVRILVEECRASNILDIWSMQEHYKNDKLRDTHLIQPHTKKRFQPPCLRGTWDAQIVDDLGDLITKETEIINKHRFGCFYNTRLETLLRMYGIKILIICGLTTLACVETTAREAYMRDYDVIVVSDAVATVSKELHEAALKIMGMYCGTVMSAKEVIDIIRNSRDK